MKPSLALPVAKIGPGLRFFGLQPGLRLVNADPGRSMPPTFRGYHPTSWCHPRRFSIAGTPLLSGFPTPLLNTPRKQTQWSRLRVGPTRMDSSAPLYPSEAEPEAAPEPGQQGLLRSFLAAQLQTYLERNPTSRRCLRLIQEWQRPGTPIRFDHLAFRTFGASGCGIQSIADFFLSFGYTCRDALTFPSKKLRAFWFAPPEDGDAALKESGSGPLPRVFASELIVEDLSPRAQEIIRKYTEAASPVARHAFALSVLDPLPWPKPEAADFQFLARESEYAAWTLVNGYALNHTTISVHSLDLLAWAEAEGQEKAPGGQRSWPLDSLNSMLVERGVKLNEQGGTVKVSPDGLLLQSSSVADSAEFAFADQVALDVPTSYMEFALRLPLPQFAHLADSQIQERHRRDGFEASNADKIFESTNTTQAGA